MENSKVIGQGHCKKCGATYVISASSPHRCPGSNIVELKAELEKVRESDFHYQTDNDLLEDVIKDLNAALETAKKRIVSQNKDTDKCCENYDKLKAELSTANKRIAELEEQAEQTAQAIQYRLNKNTGASQFGGKQ